MASLAKLCLVAGAEAEAEVGAETEAGAEAEAELWRGVESRLALSEHHAALPRALRVRHGLDEPDTRVLQPDELLQVRHTHTRTHIHIRAHTHARICNIEPS